MPIEGRDIAMMRDYMFRKRQFGIRECISKAEAILHKKLLSMEFREKEEIEFEKDEIDAVRQQKALQRGQIRDISETQSGHQEQKEHTETQGKDEIVYSTVGTIEEDVIAIEMLNTEKDKRDWLISVMNHKEHPVFNRVQKLLNGRDIVELKEKEIDGIFMVLKMEMDRGE